MTGGTKGIGFAIAESLVKTGASVFVCSRTRSDVEQAVSRNFGRRAKRRGSRDVRVENEVEAVFKAAKSALAASIF